MIVRISRRAAVAAALFASLAAAAAAAQPPVDTRPFGQREVVLDGLFYEWESAPHVAANRPRGHGPHHAVDPCGDDSPYPRLVGMQLRHDADAVYLLLRLDRDVALQALAGTLALVMDADGDSTTGWTSYGVRGVDAAVEFSPVWPRAWRAGAGLRTRSAGEDTTRLVSANAAGVMVAPSHASSIFEMRIPRGGAVPFGARMTARLMSLDADGGVVDSLRAFTAELSGGAPRPRTTGEGDTDPLARYPMAQFRVVSWNVGRETIFEHPDHYGVILRALGPDLLILDEVAGGHSAGEVEALLNRMMPGDQPWRAVYGVSGGSQRGVIATRGAAPVLVAPFDRPMEYPDSTRGIIPPDTTPAAQNWLRNRLESRVPATGAMVEIGGHRLLTVTMDLEAGGGAGGPADRLRRIEALEIRQAIQAVQRGGGVDGVLIAGDMNLVGRTDPQELLTEDLDGPGRGLWTSRPLRLDDASAATWENPAEVFTPSRLDYVLYSQRTVGVVRRFIFRSGDLSPEWQARHGVTDATSSVTDHLPVVTDLVWGPGS
jgi:hypothetical protein